MAESSKPEIVRPERGVHAPAENLQVAVDLLSRVREAVGFSPAARETIAEALGYKGISGTSGRKLALLAHFDLIERVGSGAYQISELGKRISVPTDANDARQAIAEAAKRPNLYAALVDRYQDHALPTMLANLLIREHGVFAASAEPTANAFRQTMEFAGLLQNGVLRAEVPNQTPPGDHGDPGASGADGKGGPSVPSSGQAASVAVGGAVAPRAATQAYTIPLGGDGRVASIQIPVPVTARDLRKIGSWVNYMTDVVGDEETPDISAN